MFSEVRGPVQIRSTRNVSIVAHFSVTSLVADIMTMILHVMVG